MTKWESVDNVSWLLRCLMSSFLPRLLLRSGLTNFIKSHSGISIAIDLSHHCDNTCVIFAVAMGFMERPRVFSWVLVYERQVTRAVEMIRRTGGFQKLHRYIASLFPWCLEHPWAEEPMITHSLTHVTSRHTCDMCDMHTHTCVIMCDMHTHTLWPCALFQKESQVSRDALCRQLWTFNSCVHSREVTRIQNRICLKFLVCVTQVAAFVLDSKMTI